MEKEVRFYYDNEGDILDISIGEPKKASTEEVKEDVFVRIDKSNKIVGFMIMNFQKSFMKQFKSLNKPIVAKLNESS